MGLESVTNVDDLVITNPVATDLRSVGDNHLRIIKTAVKTLLENVPGTKDGTPATLTIVAGAITPTVAVQYVDTAAAAATDDLDTITGTNMYAGGFLWLRAANTARTVVLKHGVDNIVCQSGDISLDSTDMWVLLFYDGTNYIELFVARDPGRTIADTAVTLDYEHGSIISQTPTIARILTLPTTGVKVGHTLTIVNLATTVARLITLNASAGAAVAIFVNGSITVRANQATPTTPAHWDVVGPGVRGELNDAAVTISAPGTYAGTPSDTRIWTLGSTFKVGERVTIINLASDQVITVNASGGSTITTLGTAVVDLYALQDTPTTPAHWGGEAVLADTIDEVTDATGVTIDSVLLKDSAIQTDSGGTNELLRTIVLEIGDWNMDSTNLVTVAHGLTLAKIRSFSVIIRQDDSATHYSFPTVDPTVGGTENMYATATNINLARAPSGFFDNTSFNSTSFNRGWVTIIYAV